MGGTKVVHTLSSMDGLQCPCRLELNDYAVIDDKVRLVKAHHLPAVKHFYGLLLLHAMTFQAKFDRQGVFIHLLQEAASQRVRYLIRRPDHCFRQPRFPCQAFIRVHPSYPFHPCSKGLLYASLNNANLCPIADTFAEQPLWPEDQHQDQNDERIHVLVVAAEEA